MLVMQVAAYDTVAKKMAFFDPSRAKEFLFISGTKVSPFVSINNQTKGCCYHMKFLPDHNMYSLHPA